MFHSTPTFRVDIANVHKIIGWRKKTCNYVHYRRIAIERRGIRTDHGLTGFDR